jgi:hypothetical protein
MTFDSLQYLTNIPVDEVRPIVCQALGTEAVPITPLSVVKIGRSAGTATVGIYRVAGEANTSTGTRPWSAVVKVLGAGEIGGQMDRVVAERELAVYRAGVFAVPQGGVRSPLCYVVQERNELHFIWMEDLSGAPQAPWIPEYFIQTAYHFGKFNAHWPEQDLPDWEWLSRDTLRQQYDAPEDHESFQRLSELQKHPLVGRALPPDVLQGLLQLWEEHDELLMKVEATYKGICHGDCHPKNLFPMTDTGAGTFTIAFDWTSVGIENLGCDIGMLLGSPVKWLELSLDEAAALVDPIFDAYVTGLAEAGWSGNEEQVRLTYLTCLGMGEATSIASICTWAAESSENQAILERLLMAPAEQVFERWQEALRFYLRYHNEALRLASRL